MKLVRKQPIIGLYFESEPVLKFYNREARAKRMGSSVGKLAIPFRPFLNRMNLLSFLLFLRVSKNFSHTPSFIVVVPCYQSGTTFLHTF